MPALKSFLEMMSSRAMAEWKTGIGCAGQLLPVVVRGLGGLGSRQTLPGQGRRVVAGLGIVGLLALVLLDEDRDEDGLGVVGVSLQQAAGGAELVVRIAGALVGVDQMSRTAFLTTLCG